MVQTDTEKREKQRLRWHRWYQQHRTEVLERRRQSQRKKLTAKKYRHENRDKLRKIYSDYCSSLHGHLNILLKKCRHRNLICTITLDDLKHLWEQQNGKCVLTGINMTLDSHYTNVSVDRLDTTKGYTIDNIRLTCWWVNMARNTLSDEELRRKCEAVINFCR